MSTGPMTSILTKELTPRMWMRVNNLTHDTDAMHAVGDLVRSGEASLVINPSSPDKNNGALPYAGFGKKGENSLG